MAYKLLDPRPSKPAGGMATDDLLYSQIEHFTVLRRPRQSDFSALKSMFYALIGQTTHPAKRKYAIALAHNPYTPRQLLLYLALEDIDIATPILLYSPALAERDLISIVERKGDQHAKIIARRCDLTLPTVKVLYGTGETVREILRKNPAAPEYDTKTAPEERAPVTPPATTMATAASGPRLQDPAPSKPAATRDASEKLLALAGKSGRLGRQAPAAKHGQASFDPRETGRSLLAAARDCKTGDFCRIVERDTGLSWGKLDRIIDDQDAGILASLFHVMELPKDISSRLLLMLCPKTGQDHRVFVKVMEALGKIDKSAALDYFRKLEPGFRVSTSRHHIVAPVPEYIPLLRQRRTDLRTDAPKPRGAPVRRAS